MNLQVQKLKHQSKMFVSNRKVAREVFENESTVIDGIWPKELRLLLNLYQMSFEVVTPVADEEKSEV